MVFDLYSVFRQIILNVNHGLLFTPAHCMKQTMQFEVKGYWRR